jgi:hypothetical protein
MTAARELRRGKNVKLYRMQLRRRKSSWDLMLCRPRRTGALAGRRMTCSQSLVYAAAVGSILAQPVVHFCRESFSTEFSIFQQRSYTMAKKAKKKKAKKKK